MSRPTAARRPRGRSGWSAAGWLVVVGTVVALSAGRASSAGGLSLVMAATGLGVAALASVALVGLWRGRGPGAKRGGGAGAGTGRGGGAGAGGGALALSRFESLIDRSWALIAVVDANGTVISVSGAWERLLGWDPAEAVGSDARGWLHSEDWAAMGPALRSLGPNASVTVRSRVRHRDGSWPWFEAVVANLFDDPMVGGALITARDVSAEVEAQTALERANARFTALIEHGSDLITVSDADGRLSYVSPALPRVAGLDPAALTGEYLLGMLHPDDREMVADRIRDVTGSRGGVASLECRLGHADGAWRHVELTAVNRFDDPAVGGLVCNMRDVTERVQAAERLHDQATHDSLTGLPNRVSLLRRLGETLDSTRRAGSRCSVLYIDLDGFKKVNDSLGHAAGDAVLSVVARRLRDAVRPSDVVSRLGGDEFVVTAENVADTAVAIDLANRIRAAIGRPVRVGHRSISVGCSIGIAVSDHHGPAALLQEADTALYRAKERGRNRWEVYDHAMKTEARRRLDTEELLRGALDDGGLVLVYQPIVGLPDEHLTGVEALLRLRGPDGELVGPADFIDVAEESGLIVPVGAGVLDLACRQAAEWNASGAVPDSLVVPQPAAVPEPVAVPEPAGEVHGPERRARALRVSVNISPRQLISPGLVAQVRHTLAAWELPPELLCLELTENALIDAGLSVRSSLRELKGMGISIAIDDFGTGWSSLRYLRRFPVDVVKIDRSFVAGLGVDASDTEVVRAVIGLGHALGLDVVAEGVETHEQSAILAELGCHHAQGYLFGRPSPPETIAPGARPGRAALGATVTRYDRHDGGGGGRESNPPDGDRPSHPL